MYGGLGVYAIYIRVQAFVKHSDLLSNSSFALKSQNTKGEGMYLIFPVLVIVIVTVTVLLQCLSCSFGQN